MLDPLAFGLAVFAVLATPGPTNTLLMTSGAVVGVWRSLPLLLAEILGYNLSLFVVGTVPTTAGLDTHGLRVMLSLAAGAYLVMVAAALWRRPVVVTSRPVSWLQVFVTTLLNPKVLIFLLVIPFSASNASTYIVAFSALVVSLGGCWIVVGALTRSVLPIRISALVPKAASVALGCLALVLIGSQWIS